MRNSVSGAERIRARAWCRADLAGGTLDIWPLGLLHRGARTVNLALDLPVEVVIERSPGRCLVRQQDSVIEARSWDELAVHADGALIGLIARHLGLPSAEVSVRSFSPRGGGLGASSALAVALIAGCEACLGLPESSPEERSALARDIEAQLMSLPTGRQDHFSALLGGLLDIRHQPGGEKIRHLQTDLNALGRSLIIAYTGQSHFSADNNWQIVRRRLDAEPETVGLFEGIRETATELVEALERNDLQATGELMGREWSLRRRLAVGISTPEIETLLAAARAAGAWGGKACGAGGGGCIIVLCPPQGRADVAEALAAAGGEVLTTLPNERPLEVGRL